MFSFFSDGRLFRGVHVNNSKTFSLNTDDIKQFMVSWDQVKAASNKMTSILNPIIPFCVSLPENKLNNCNDVVVAGEAFYGAQRFSINFIQSKSKTRLFHLDFRFDQNETVLNSNYPDGFWGQEERTPLPLLLGRKFNIEIKCSSDRFVIIVDFQYHCDFIYRFNMSEADSFLIEGDVHIQTIQFD